MPVIKKQTQPPLPPPGESVGILKQMSCVWVTPKPGSKIKEPYQAFKGTLQLYTGEKVPVSIGLLEQTAFMIRNLCRSAELLVPEDGSEFILTCDDLENCRVFVGIKHEDYNGRTVARIAFHTESYATQVNPSLGSVTFPGEAPRGTRLTAVARSSEEPPKEPPADPPAAPAIPKTPVEPAGSGSTSFSDLGTISDEEFEEAIRNAREQRTKKDAPQ
jgi:hypothetical protein